MTLKSRIDELEKSTIVNGGVVIVVRRDEESDAEAIDRHCSETDLDKARVRYIVFSETDARL